MIQNSATVDISVRGWPDGSIGMIPSDTDADAILIHIMSVVVDKICTGMEGSVSTELHKRITGSEDNIRQRHALGRDESDPATHAD